MVEAGNANAQKLLRVLKDFGFGSLDLSAADFTEESNIIQPGCEPVRIDILTSLKGHAFSDIWQCRLQGPSGSQTVHNVDRKHLIRSKQLSNRTRERADLESLL